jgi:periplasmic copper chaperone A
MKTPASIALGAAILISGLVSGAISAQAHITLETQEAQANSSYMAVLRVGHGCEGAPTIKVRVQIPEGVIAVKPMPKPGWTLETKVSKYAKSYEYYSHTLSEGVTEITWSGGNLSDAWYDEFIFRARLTDAAAGSVVYFPTVQECPGGAANRWIEIPEAGKTRDDYKSPAPQLVIIE